MIIWGWRRYVHTIAMITFVCGQCGNPAAHALRRFVTKFTLFFVPLFPVHRRFEVQCTFCGATGKVTRDQAEAMRAQPQGQSQPPVPQQQPPGSQYPTQEQYPTQSRLPQESTAQFPQPHLTGNPTQPGQPG